MKLIHLTLDQLSPSRVNVRKKGGKEIADLLPSIRRLGILQPLLVRASADGYEVVAGQRRLAALTALAAEGIADPVPVIVMQDGDDATAIEASLTENIARLPMDEIDQYKAFAALRGEGLEIGDIAARFGVSERLVTQRLAIAGIIEPVLNAYRRDEISAETLRVLTMATPRQQKDWWKLFKDKESYAPQGRQLRSWLFGGGEIRLDHALFDLEQYTGPIISDLFSEARYFGDVQAFWSLQHAAIAARREAYLAKGWEAVVVLDIGQHVPRWDYVKVPKARGGKVYVSMTADGEVSFLEGYLPEREARRRQKQEAEGGKPDGGPLPSTVARGELTKPMHNYIGLHKHAAVRTELLAHPRIALRLTVAHMIAGSDLWKLEADRQKAASPAIQDSLAASLAEQGFAEERRRIHLLLGLDDTDAEDSAEHDGGHGDSEAEDADAEASAEAETDEDEAANEHDSQTVRRDGPVVFHGQGCWLKGRCLARIFESLMHMEDSTVMRILTFAMAETLEAQTGTVDALGLLLGTDMRNWWEPDEVFFDLLRDKQAINAMVREVAGDVTAGAHALSTAKIQKKIVADCLNGTRTSEVKAGEWIPPYMAFPPRGYTTRFEGPITPDWTPKSSGREAGTEDDAAAEDDGSDLDDCGDVSEAA
ncbi:ParB/RepB/Spo0J family partition protein [Stappia indica]|uniref:ParB/RepB/Spo0J family partition protein n=1 Tax=Stappia indica TaxID=538381 RepID=UPI001D17E18F|nr:ParB/RepB/Spo0J family partition protein [Stappia indica]MCC4242968.1 ParB/RepB/Spo0J family partition protein [Stappia indica]